MTKLTSVRGSSRGFTIYEMMIAVAIIGLLAAMAAPSFRSSMARSAIKGTTIDLIVALNTARAQAVNTRTDVILKSTDGADWSNGWTIDYSAATSEKDSTYVPELAVTVTEAQAGTQSITFSSTGLLSANLKFQVCNSSYPEIGGRQITVNRAGKITNDAFAGC